MTIKELHQTRIKNDFDQMCRIRNSPMVSWVATKGTEPYVEEYLITIKVRTYSGPGEVMNECKVRITLPPQYPTVAPNTVMEGKLVFHPNWYTSGRWCCGKFYPSESLGNYVVRLIQTLQFDPVVTNPNSPANTVANTWYTQNLNKKGMFPSDKTPLPNPNPQLGFKRIR